MLRKFLLLLTVTAFLTGKTAIAQDVNECSAMCEQGAQEVLAKCHKNHGNDPDQCPADDGSIPEQCRKICNELSNLSPEELQKKLPQNYKDILEGK